MANHVEIEDFLTPERIEWAYGQAQKAQEQQRDIVAQTGMRAARARDPKLLKALEKAAEHTLKMHEAQMGRTRRSTEIEGYKVEATEHQLFREALVAADKGEPLQNFAWLYGAAAIMIGYVS
jgi:hypothetical protein